MASLQPLPNGRGSVSGRSVSGRLRFGAAPFPDHRSVSRRRRGGDSQLRLEKACDDEQNGRDGDDGAMRSPQRGLVVKVQLRLILVGRAEQ